MPVRLTRSAVSGLVLMLAVALSGCTPAQWRDANDARRWLCDNLAAEHEAELRERAAAMGFALDVIREAWKQRCLLGHEQLAADSVGAIGTLEAP